LFYRTSTFVALELAPNLILYNSNVVKHSCNPCSYPSIFSFFFLHFTALTKSYAFSFPSRATHNHPGSYMRRQTTKQEITTGSECSIRKRRSALFFIYIQQCLSLTLWSQSDAVCKIYSIYKYVVLFCSFLHGDFGISGLTANL
jgi:hypothetical protein